MSNEWQDGGNCWKCGYLGNDWEEVTLRDAIIGNGLDDQDNKIIKRNMRIPCIVFDEDEESIAARRAEQGRLTQENEARKVWRCMKRSEKKRSENADLVKQHHAPLLRECTSCGRYMLEMAGDGSPLDFERGSFGEVPTKCPGCKLNHVNWLLSPLLDTNGVHMEQARQERIQKSTRKQLRTPFISRYRVHVRRNDDNEREQEPTPLQASLLMGQTTDSTDGSVAQRRLLLSTFKKWTQEHRRYSTWCRKVGFSTCCSNSQNDCFEHNIYNTDRILKSSEKK